MKLDLDYIDNAGHSGSTPRFCLKQYGGFKGAGDDDQVYLLGSRRFVVCSRVNAELILRLNQSQIRLHQVESGRCCAWSFRICRRSDILDVGSGGFYKRRADQPPSW
jgi:hypothetical protein